MTRPSIHRFIVRIYLFLFVIIIAASAGCRKRVSAEPEFTTSTAQLIADYENNISSANDKYEGKTILVTGKVVHFAVIRETIGINLETEDRTSRWRVMCLFDKSDKPDAYAELERRKHTKFIGEVRRVPDRDVVQLLDCRFAE